MFLGDTLDVIILPPVDTNNIYINVEFDNYKHYRICAYFKWTLLKVVEVCKEMNEGRCEHDSLRLYGNELDLGKTLEFYNIENGISISKKNPISELQVFLIPIYVLFFARASDSVV